MKCDAQIYMARSSNLTGVSAFEPLLNLEEAAKLLRVHPKTLEKWARSGLTPAYQLGRWKFRASELDLWLKQSVSSKAASRSGVGR